jgi:hypothetical protein
MNMSRVTQHSVPRVLTQGQLGDGMRISDDLINICVSVCEYLVIWSGKTTVHKILDYSSTSIIQINWKGISWVRYKYLD